MYDTPVPKQINHTHHGKWSEVGVPKRGWSCVHVEDLGEPAQLCEMCENVEIRYVHEMQHPDYSGTLSVGCICAEHMEEDYVRPKEREKQLKSAARRRKTWAKRAWSQSSKGNLYINIDGFNITVFPKRAVWALSITNRLTDKTRKGIRSYPTQLAAQAAGFDALLWAKRNCRLTKPGRNIRMHK